MPLTRQRCVEVAAPYEVRVNKFVQTSRADNIQPYCILFRYSLLLITLSVSEITAYAEPVPLAGAPNRLIRKSQLINPFNHITRLQHMQEKSRQVLLSGLKLFMNT